MNNNTYGIVLDGKTAVGKFVFITEEDKFGQREIMKLDISPIYIDICNGKTNKHLRFFLVEDIVKNQNVTVEIDNQLTVNILADLGIGMIQGKFVLDENQAHYKKAVFNKIPKILNPKFN